MSTYYVRPKGGLTELYVGGTYQGRKITAIEWKRAEEDDPKLGIKAGDMYCVMEVSGPPSEKGEPK